MLYPKSQTEKLDENLFRSPTSEYRGAPFWAWNTHPEKGEMRRQMEIFREMGFGGFHMHVRSGMDVEYLSDAFFDTIRFCVEETREKGMLAWLYDEDRWPSGAVGGKLTKDPANRQHYLLFTPTPYCGYTYKRPLTASGSNYAERAENGTLLAAYDIQLDADGYLKSARLIGEDEIATGKKWYAYVESPSANLWYNGQTYADLLNPQVTRRFVEMTHEAYKRELGGRFDCSVTPAIFTDEPQMAQKRCLPDAHSTEDAVLPWTVGLEADFRAETGVDLLAGLPQLFWNCRDDRHVELRWQFHNYLAERFARSFADVCGTWCRENGIPLTGHVMREPTLASQMGATGETMRSYRSFTIPGIDMLRNSYEYTTAKQCQSAVRQYGREGMTSELYGCTGWNYDFAGYKRQGDWQAALGVTVRVPHLSFLSMRGEAKRDYPASIHYQSPWYHEFSMVEDHFARLATVMTRGKEIPRVGVIHPIESYWLAYGPEKESADEKNRLDSSFLNLTQWLLLGGMDFDLISEALLPDLCPEGGAPLTVGKMRYDAVIVPPVLTLRQSTVERLRAFVKNGGKLIFTSEMPGLINARPSDQLRDVYEKSTVLPFEKQAILAELEEYRELWIYEDQTPSDRLLFRLRQDGDVKWLFLAQGTEERYEGAKVFRVVLNGDYVVEEFDTATGEHRPLPAESDGKKTVFLRKMYDCDSLLLRLTERKNTETVLPVSNPFSYTLSEPNVLLLDAAEYALDGEEYQPRTELLLADNECRKRLGFALRQASMVQPWVFGRESMVHRIRLRFTILSEIGYDTPRLAVELCDGMSVFWNGRKVETTADGYYVDKSISILRLPPLLRGENHLEITMPFGQTSNTEWCYLLGDFGVRNEGNHATVVAKAETLQTGDLAHFGMPFYGGMVRYCCRFSASGGECAVSFPSFGGTYVAVSVDGERKGIAAYPPEQVLLGRLPAGEHILTAELCVSRTNAFGSVHFVDGAGANSAPLRWRYTDENRSDDYVLVKQGLFASPVITEKK